MIALVIMIVSISALIIRRVIAYHKKVKEEKKVEQEHTSRREKYIQAIRKRSIGGEKLIDYAEYELSFSEMVKYSLIAAGVLFGVAYIFYDHIIIASIVAIGGVFYPKIKKNSLKEKRKDELTLQFKEAIASLSSSLAAGQSIENAFSDALKDLKLLYPDDEAYIIKEFTLINRRIENGEIIERAIDDFAKRSDIDDIQNFSNVFITCKRSGGDLVDVIKQTSDIITDKIEIQQDIKVLVSQKKFESKIMAIAPLGIILFLKTSSPDFVAPLFDFSGPGPIIMTIALVFIICSLWISQKIMDIKV